MSRYHFISWKCSIEHNGDALKCLYVHSPQSWSAYLLTEAKFECQLMYYTKNFQYSQCTVVGIVKLRLYCLSFKDVCEKEEDNEKSSSSPPKERPTRLNLVTTRNRSHSSSPATNHKRYSRIGRYLKDTGNAMSYKSLNELEFEEVKGFIDLGFIFRRGHISKNLVSVLPGLQKLEIVMSKDKDKICEDSEAIHIDGIVAEVEEDDKREIVRPYLSEAWLIKRPDSPLLNMKIPRISAASDMKKHLRYWAKTVANVVLQES